MRNTPDPVTIGMIADLLHHHVSRSLHVEFLPTGDSTVDQIEMEVSLDPQRPPVRVTELGKSDTLRGRFGTAPFDGSAEEVLQHVSATMPDEPKLTPEQILAAKQFGSIAYVLAGRLGTEQQSAYGRRTIYGFSLMSGERVRAMERLGERSPQGGLVFTPESAGVSFDGIEAARLADRPSY